MKKTERQALAVAAGMIGFHVACLGAFLTGVSKAALATAAVLYVVRAFGVTAGFHRYFAHRAFRTGRLFQFLLALLGSLATQGGVLWWVAHHREHHKHTETRRDIHSPVAHGFWQAHMGWMWTREAFAGTGATAKELHRYPELRFLQRWYVPLILFQGAAIYAFGAWLGSNWPATATSGPQMLVWAYFVSTVALWHATFMVNSVCHRWGAAPWDTGDQSRNNWLVALLTLGEGWHNNHHRYAGCARHGLRWWQLDLTYLGLCLLQALGVVRDLRLEGPAAAR